MSAYFIAQVTVTDPEGYKEYASQTEALVKPFGGRFLVKGGAQEDIEGSSRARTAVIEFSDRDSALAWYHSDEYTRLRGIALRCSEREAFVVEGV